jgi:hypothetical protein
MPGTYWFGGPWIVEGTAAGSLRMVNRTHNHIVKQTYAIMHKTKGYSASQSGQRLPMPKLGEQSPKDKCAILFRRFLNYILVPPLQSPPLLSSLNPLLLLLPEQEGFKVFHPR